MAATTVAQLEALLSGYAETGGNFTQILSQVLSRIYNMGTYRDLTVQYSLPVIDGCVTLPEDADAILHTLIDSNPMPVRSLWHDYKNAGLNGGDMSWGLIDSGYWATKILLPDTTDTLYITPSVYSDTFTDFDPTVEGVAVVVVAQNATRTFTGVVDDSSSSAVSITFDEVVNHVVSIRFDGLTDRYDVRLDANDPATSIATIGTGAGVTRYRRFRLSGSVDGSTTVHVLCKRAFVAPVANTDIVYMGNVNAIKHGLLARMAEDNTDAERATYHWQQAMLLMEEEASSTRGAAVPRLNIDPYGMNGQGGIQQML